MNTFTLALDLLVVQGLLGAFDTLYHHELRAALPQQPSAVLELRIHAMRALLYGAVFAGLAWLTWGGAWLLVLVALVAIEVVLTLWDFVVEDQSRLLPRSERVLHTILAINGGAVFGLLALNVPDWWALDHGLYVQAHGWQSIALSFFAVGVVISGIRDGLASRNLAQRSAIASGMHFSPIPQHVIVTGGTGFIGQALCHALLADGHELTLLVRDPIKAAYLYGARVRCITRLEELPATTHIDVIINLAGERIVGPRWSAARRARLIASRVDTTQALVAWVGRAIYKPRLMISASAVGYYGIQDTSDPAVLKEDAPGQPVFVSQLCQQWESAARGVAVHGVPLAILRLGLVFGYQGVLPAMLLPFLIGLGGRIGSGKQVMSWVHIEDVIGTIAHLMALRYPKSAHGTYNVTAPQTVTQALFAKTVAGIWRRPSGVPMPGMLFRLLLGAQATLLLDGQRVQAAMLTQSGYRFRYPQLQSALQSLRR